MKPFTKKIAFVLLLVFVLPMCSTKKKDDTLKNLILFFLLQNLTRKTTTTTVSSTSSCISATSVDPFYANQWHLSNDGTLSTAVSGEDAKVNPVWSGGNLGQDVLVAVVDDGLEVAHEDLKDNISTTVNGYNSRNGGTDPSHSFSTSGHGTNVGGVIAARYNNGIGTRGAAPCATLTGRNILESSITTSIESTAMTQDISKIFISNNSWGATDKTGTLAASSSVWQSAIDSGLSTGRNGKGTIYTWAAGNGASNAFTPSTITPTITGITLPATSMNQEIDNSNYDGQANYYGVMAICGVGINGVKAYYSEEGANLWVCAHTQGNSSTASTTAISTTDPTGSAGYNTNGSSSNFSNLNYNNKFNGTSSATPLASGVIALLLQAYPNLGWRDVREIIARSARKNDSTDSDWVTNGAGLNINHKYGFGTIDANSALTFAKTWTPLTGSQIVTSTVWQTNGGTAVAIPDNNTGGASQNITVTSSGISSIEWVTLEFVSAHTFFADLTIVLTSPAGTKSILAKKHNCLLTSGAQGTCPMSSVSNTWKFGSARHLGEAANGTWTVQVWDTATGDTGSFVAKISFRGR
jgi:proprotein convertase subtilisin/kexin type 2